MDQTSRRPRSDTLLALKVAWCSLGLILAVAFAVLYQQGRDWDVVRVYTFLALGFPSSVVYAGLIVAAYELAMPATGWGGQYNATLLFLQSIGFVLVGYAQWFWFLPKLLEWMRDRRRTPD